MDAADSLVPLGASIAAVVAVTAAVLADVVAFDRRERARAEGERPAKGRHEARPEADAAVVGGIARAADAAVADAPRVRVADSPVRDAPARHAPVRDEGARETPYAPLDESMLGALASTDVDERSALRRIVSALVLLALTLLTAALIGAGIYRGIQSLSE